MKKFVCPVCGYVYEGEFIPEGFKCPVCGVDGSKFKVMEEGKLAAEHEYGIYAKTVKNNPDISEEDKKYIPPGGLPRDRPVLGEGRPRGSRARRQVRRDAGRGSGAPHEGHHQGQSGLAC